MNYLKKLNFQISKVKSASGLFNSAKMIGTHQRNYKDYGFIIASILKESGKPLSGKQIYQELAKIMIFFPIIEIS